jgi:hypothetical protein
MNAPRCTDTDYIDFLVATPRAVSCAEAARVQPRRADAPPMMPSPASCTASLPIPPRCGTKFLPSWIGRAAC